MDYNQDFAVNRLHVLDDTNVSCDKNACAVFNGGIYVEKDIHAANIHIRNFKNKYLSTSVLDVSTGNVQNLNVKNITVLDSICPSDILTTATLGCCDKKWNAVYATNGNFQVINTNTSNIKNLKYENMLTIVSIQDIPINFNPAVDFIVQLDKDIIFINIYSISLYTDDSLITIRIPESTVFYEHHKIVLNQICKYKIFWVIPGNINFISDANTQVYEIINIPYARWKLINYSNISNITNCGYKKIYSNSEPGSGSESGSESETESDPEYDTDCSNIVVSNQSHVDSSGTIIKYIKKTYLKYIYKQKDIFNEPALEQIHDTIIDLSNIIMVQNAKISKTDNMVNILKNSTTKLEEQFDCFDSELKLCILRIDELEKLEKSKRCTNTTHSSYLHVQANDNIKKIMDTVEDLAKTVKKNEKKIEDLDKKISNTNSKMKKILKYLNLN